jgi:hypothetical protein
VKNQRPIAAEEEHRVLQFRPRNSVRTPDWRGNPATPPQRNTPPERKNPESKNPESKNPESKTPERTAPELLDLSRYERPREEPDDFRHRMLANIAAFAFTVALMAIGIWLVVSIADLRKTQDCVLMGRRDCVRISVP